MAKITVLAFTSMNPQKQVEFRKMVEESDYLKNRVELTIASNDEEALKALPDAEVFLCYRFPPDWLPLAKKLKWMHVGWAGIDHVLTPELVKSSVRITNARGIHAEVQSDYIIGAMVMWSRRLLWAERFRQERRWSDYRKPMILEGFALKKKVLLIIGFGAIGKVLARKAAAMGMIIHAVKRHPRPEEALPCTIRLWTIPELDVALPQADFVTLLIPFTPQNRGFFGHDKFLKMKPTAFFMNTSRGLVVDEAALIQALQEKRIAGAALDVFQNEPLPDDSPLWDFDNVILTPHIGGNYPEYTMDAYEQFVANLERYVRGDLLLNEANKELGY
jgi:phosphoglycerate dehydrogenase-like enzyme